MNPTDKPPETYWDLLQDVARLQGQMGEDLVMWAQAYEAGGRAFQHTAQTLDLMADVGRRMEQFLTSGPPATVQQALQLFAAPWQSGAPGAGTVDPFRRFWELWASALPGARQSTDPNTGGSAGTG